MSEDSPKKSFTVTIPVPKVDVKTALILLVFLFLAANYVKNEIGWSPFSGSSSIEKKAAAGGAAVPFPSVVPLPTPTGSQPIGSMPGQAALTPTNTCEKSSPSSPAPNSGNSSRTRYRPRLIQRIR